MAVLIRLRDRMSHTFRMDGVTHTFWKNKGRYTSNKKVIAYVKSMSRGMFAITENVEPPRPKPNASAEPLEPGVAAGSSSTVTKVAASRVRPSAPRRKSRVTPDDS